MDDRQSANRDVLSIIRAEYDSIFAAERKAADFVLRAPEAAVGMTVAQLAKNSGVSDATVIRMCHHLGFTGYYQFRLRLASDIGAKQSYAASSIDGAGAVENLFHGFAEQMTALGKQITVDAMRESVRLLKECDIAHLIAVGNTTPLTQYMGFRLGRLGIRASFGFGGEYFLNHINLAGAQDVIVAISQSGSSRQVIHGLELGKEKGLRRIVITGDAQSPAASLADIVLPAAVTTEPPGVYKAFSQLNLMAVTDALLRFVTNAETIEKKQADKPEFLLSENKM